MNRHVWTMVAIAGLALSGCGSKHNSPTGSTAGGGGGGSGGGGGPPTDFVSFVNQQVQTQPAFGSTPAVTSSLTTDLGLGDATVFSSVTFGTGDALPSGTNQASLACSQAGQSKCNPGVSADLNSNLN